MNIRINIQGLAFRIGLSLLIALTLSSFAYGQDKLEDVDVNALNLACQSGHVPSCEQGVELWDDDKIDNDWSALFLDKSCQLGNAESCYDLALFYDPDRPEEGFEPDLKRYISLMDRACVLDDGWNSCQKLAKIYDTGDEVSKDKDKAEYYRGIDKAHSIRFEAELEEKCQAGDPLICYRLGKLGDARKHARQACLSGKTPQDRAENCNRVAKWDNPVLSKDLGLKTAADIISEIDQTIAFYEKACRIGADYCRHIELGNLARTRWGKDNLLDDGITWENQPSKSGDNWAKLADASCMPMSYLAFMNNQAFAVDMFEKTLQKGQSLMLPFESCKTKNADKDQTDPTPSDRDAKPIVRLRQAAPWAFMQKSQSGYCDISYSVSDKGLPEDIRIKKCTDELLEAPTRQTVKKWRYAPKIFGGQPIRQTGLETRVTYQMTNDKGEILPYP